MKKNNILTISIWILLAVFLMEAMWITFGKSLYERIGKGEITLLYKLPDYGANLCVPGVFGEQKMLYTTQYALGTVDDHLYRLFVPGMAKSASNGNVRKSTEDEGAYEKILFGEAQDENYINKEGELILLPTQGGKEESAKEKNKSKVFEKIPEDLTNEDYVRNTYYTVDATTYTLPGELNGEVMMAKDYTIEKDTEHPQILIYHTHSQEAFSDSVNGDSSTTIVGVGEYLAHILKETYGYQVMHNTTEFDMSKGSLDRNKAYTYAEQEISGLLSKYPSIEVVIDLHRDACGEGSKFVTECNGKPTARFMFFNGMSRTCNLGEISYLPNEYREDNMAFAFQLQEKAAKYYPGLTRKIYLKGYRYNLHLKKRCLLVECGAQNNTLQEEKNAMEPLAHILSLVLSGQE